ncbi:MAG: Mut7-C RNAse domain-containing protein [Anaerolineales bacterium]
MNYVYIRFKEELNDFLPPHRKNIMFSFRFRGQPSVKHLIEAIGIPHTEVGEILVNSNHVELTYKASDMDEIIVKPKVYSQIVKDPANSFESNDPPKFVLDSHLGKLAVYLRMFGLDTLYQNDYDDDLLAEISFIENRVLLTRDRGLLKRKIIIKGYWIRSLDPSVQIEEVFLRFNLFDKVQPFQRCLVCNYSLKPVDKESVIKKLEPLTRKYYNKFFICTHCQKVYWKGSHYERMKAFVQKIVDKGEPSKYE